MRNLQLSPSEICYASLLDYSPRGVSEISVKSRKVVRDGVKYDRARIIEKAAKLLSEHASQGLNGFFGKDVTLVPVPRSVPLRDSALWPSMRICEEIEKAGLSGEILPCLKRVKPTQKSSFSAPGNRPSPEAHADTIKSIKGDLLPWKFLLVDDFITRGSIVCACAVILKDAFPNASVKAFALVRTRGLVNEITKIVSPDTGIVKYQNDRLERSP